MGRLSLFFLGAPEVRHADEPLTFPSRKALALLAYLAVEGGVHSREKLMALFWPESDTERSQAALRTTLIYLRRALGEAAGTGASAHLRVERETLGFDFAADHDLDLHALQAAWTLIRAPVQRPDRAAPAAKEPSGPELAQLQSAAARYRSDFLDGLSLRDAPGFDDWVGLQREVWRRRMSAVYDRLSRLQAEGGEFASAIEVAARWVAHNPLNEAAHRRLMRLHFAAGDRAAALHAYTACQAVLERELNATPAPETEALAERIRAEAPPPQERGERGPARPAAKRGTSLIGRAVEHGELVRAYRQARKGTPQVVTLEGEPGIGKTRLASEFLGWATAEGAEVLQGRALETGGGLPYHPLVNALRSRLERDAGPFRALGPVWLAELSRLLPELAEHFPALPAPLASGEAEARTRLFEAFARLALSRPEQAPLVIFLDDLQWADTTSLAVLAYALQRWGQARGRVLLLCSLRSDDLATSALLTGWLSGLEREQSLTRLTLGPLLRQDTIRLVQDIGVRDAEQVGAWLFARTAGQPFFLIETLKALAEREGMARDGDGAGLADLSLTTLETMEQQGALAESVRAMVRVRLARLSSQAQTACTVGAVLGDEFVAAHACQVADLAESEGLLALEELLQRGILREAAGRCSFAHDQLRQVAYAEIGALRRRFLHHRALEALEATAPPAALLRHALAAGLADPAFHWSMQAGDEAIRLFAVRDAIGFYERARELAAQSLGRSLTLEEARHLYLQLGQVYEVANEMTRARETYEALLAFARQADEPVLECLALNRLALVAANAPSNLQTATALLEEALQAAERSSDKAALAETECNLAMRDFYKGTPTPALPHAERALALAREAGLQELIPRILNVLSYAEKQLARFEQMEAHAAEAEKRYAALRNRAMEADCLGQVAIARIYRGQTQAGIEAARAAQAMALEIENPWGQANGAINLVPGLLDVGSYEEAFSVAQQGVAIARAHHMAPMLILCLIVLGQAQRALSMLDAALTAHLEAMQINEAMPWEPFSLVVVPELYADYALAGDWATAYTYAARAVESRGDSFLGGGLLRWYETEALIRAGEQEQARTHIHAFGQANADNPRYRLSYLRSLAVLARQDGNLDQALEHLREAAHLAEAMLLPGELWPILAESGELSRQQGGSDEAHHAFLRAAQVIQELADALKDESQRTTFLSAQPVRQVLQHVRAS